MTFFVKGGGTTNTDSADAISNTISNNNTGQKQQDANEDDMLQYALQVDSEWGYEQIADVQEKCMNLHQDEPELIKTKIIGNSISTCRL